MNTDEVLYIEREGDRLLITRRDEDGREYVEVMLAGKEHKEEQCPE